MGAKRVQTAQIANPKIGEQGSSQDRMTGRRTLSFWLGAAESRDAGMRMIA